MRELREHLGWTQHQLSEAVGVSDSEVGHWEHGRAPLKLEHVKKIAKAFDLPMDALGEQPGSPLPAIKEPFLTEWQPALEGLWHRFLLMHECGHFYVQTEGFERVKEQLAKTLVGPAA